MASPVTTAMCTALRCSTTINSSRNPIPVEQALHGFDRVAPASIDTLLSQLGCGPPGASKINYWHNESRQFPLSKWQAAVPRLRRAPCSLFLEQNAFNHCDGHHNSRESSVDIPTLERKMQNARCRCRSSEISFKVAAL